MWDQIIIVVNSSNFGGAGGGLTVASANVNGLAIATHEAGHSFPGLADEYGGFLVPYIGPPPTEANVDTNPFSPKWSAWIENPAPPLPTPDIASNDSVVGAFNGARFYNIGIYRPMRTCLMKTFGVPFCPICKEQHLKSFFEIVPFTRSVTPQVAAPTLVSSSQTFTVNSVPVDEISYEWFMNGQRIAGATSATLSRTTAQLPASTQQLSVNARYGSAMMRSDQPSDSFSWTVKNTGITAAGTPHWWLASNSLPVSNGADTIDHDSDGQTTASEYIAGTNPNDRTSVLRFSTANAAPSGGTLVFQTIAGRRYRLESCFMLDDWTPVPGFDNIDGTAGTVSYSIPSSTATRRFFRLAVWIP